MTALELSQIVSLAVGAFTGMAFVLGVQMRF